MLHDGRAQQVEADDVIAQLSAKTGGDRFGDLDGCKLDGALPEHVPGQWRNGDAAGLSAVEERLDLPVPFHPLGKTHPTGAFAWAEHRPHQGENAGRLDDANAELAQGGPEFRCSLHIDRLNAHATFLEISLRSLRR